MRLVDRSLTQLPCSGEYPDYTPDPHTKALLPSPMRKERNMQSKKEPRVHVHQLHLWAGQWVAVTPAYTTESDLVLT